MHQSFKVHWGLDDIHFLNHGSFGACPKAVLEYQRTMADRMEAQPVRFYVRDIGELANDARTALGQFVGADPEDLAWVNNATTGVNTVLRSLEFAPGDELIVATQEYNASRNALEFVAERAGATVVEAVVPYPIDGPETVVAAFVAAMTERTKLVLVDHVVSQTGLVFPVGEIIREAKARGIDVLVDGAHAPGMLPLDLKALQPTYYTGNCHKWVCAPKSVAFLYVDPAKRTQIRPLVISHGANAPVQTPEERFRREFEWVGTSDVTAMLAVPRAIEFMGNLLPGGWEELRAHNHAMVLQGRDIVADALGVEPPCPEEMVGSLASIPLPDGGPKKHDTPLYLDPAQTDLLENHHIEVPIIPWPKPPKRLIRLSAQIYNDIGDYWALAHALPKVL